MPVSGIVVTLDERPEARAEAMARLDGDARLTLGPATHLKLPVVIDTSDAEAQQRAWDDVEATPGVRFVELVYHDFSDLTEVPEHVWLRRKRGRL